jgi:hypothetical protein
MKDKFVKKAGDKKILLSRLLNSYVEAANLFVEMI